MEFQLADLFECVADAVPDRPAVVAGDVRQTFRELDARASRLAHHLRDAGVGPGDHVGIHAQNRAEWLESMLGAFKACAVPININYRYVEDELFYLFDDADLVALIHERKFAPRIIGVRNDLAKLRHLVCLEDGSDEDVSPLSPIAYEDALGAASPERDFAPRAPDDLYVLYTGGTTGLPKGTMWRHEDIFFAALGGGNFGGEPIAAPEDLGRNAAAAVPQTGMTTAPLMHGGGQWTSLITLFGGNRLVLHTNPHFDGAEVARIVERERVNSMLLVGDAMARPFADALSREDARWDLSSLSVISSGGAILSKAVKQELRDRVPHAVVMDSFGASETGYNGTVLDVGTAPAGPRFTLHPETMVLDDDGAPVAPGSGLVGRLARRGHIPLGYYKDAEKTAQTLVEYGGERWVIPGDFATVEEDGTITLLGRGSVCINSGGEKIYPEEVEAALKSHADVFDAVVVGVPDERFGERVAAIVQTRGRACPSLEILAEHCRTKLAGYKSPRELVHVDEIVRTAVGKPDYRWAKRRALGEE